MASNKITLASTAIKEIKAHPFYNEGALEIHNATVYGVISYDKDTSVTVKVTGSATVSVAKDTALNLNIYKENGKFYIQNSTAGAVDLYISVYPLMQATNFPTI
jgi:hypothetical protein